ncbi:MAG: hypothetical protein MJ074_06700 [Oscillospiraceae bacterium]|nr:hypothetical protein [Oscillospiraceae bacterium]
MEMNEQTQTIDPDYAEVFGLEPSENADTGSDEGTAGSEESAAAEPTGGAESAQDGQEGADGSQDTGDGRDTPESAQEAVEGKRDTMSAEERHQQAAARRAREEQIRQQAEQARVDKIYADMFSGQANPFTGKPILTEADYQAYVAERDHRRNEESLKKAGIDPGTLNGIVQQAVQKETAPLQQQLMESRMAAARERAAAINQRTQEAITAELKKISAMDPGVKTLEDIAKMETAEQVNTYVQKHHLPLSVAFELANKDAINARRIEAAKAATRSGMANKQHLNPVGSGEGKEEVSVPADARAAYLEMFPNAKEDEIRREYAKYLKSVK